MRIALFALAAAAFVAASPTPAAAQQWGCGINQWGQQVCGQMRPTCEQQPYQPGCYGNPRYSQGYTQPQARQECWFEIDNWGRQQRRCRTVYQNTY